MRSFSGAETEGKREFDIPLHLASSSARGLADLYFYLRHKAAKNDLLIIDEPESHLDTHNQILLARILARFVRAGIKVLITTHSDYIIKEVNNLIMLSQLGDDNGDTLRSLNYSESDQLDPSSVRAYVAQDHSLTPANVDEFGIDMPVFDDTIDKINRVSRKLAAEVESRTRRNRMSGTKGFADQLKDVLRADKLQKIKHRDGSLEGEAVLTDAKMCFEVTNLPISSTVVKIGLLNHLAGVRDDIRELKSICDYLLVIPNENQNQWSAVLIEMKKTLMGEKKPEKKPKEQLRRSIPVVKYLESLCAIHAKRDWEVVMRYVVVAEKESPRPEHGAHQGGCRLPAESRKIRGNLDCILCWTLSDCQGTARWLAPSRPLRSSSALLRTDPRSAPS